MLDRQPSQEPGARSQNINHFAKRLQTYHAFAARTTRYKPPSDFRLLTPARHQNPDTTR